MIRLTRAQVREVDRRAIEEYGIPGIVLMENAARGATGIALTMLAGARRATIVCGGGNNGGDGLAMARHLHIAGVDVTIVESWEAEPRGDAATNFDIISAMKLRTFPAHDAADYLNRESADLVIDALFGTGLKKPIEGDQARLVELMNAFGAPILAIDLPSGLDCDSGRPLGACVKAAQTVTFVAEKAGFAYPASREFTGVICVCGIGAPQEIVDAILRASDLTNGMAATGLR
jgi:NAD(P)H-hydrate epimerase